MPPPSVHTGAEDDDGGSWETAMRVTVCLLGFELDLTLGARDRG